MKQHREHPVRVNPVKNLLLPLGLSLTRKDLTYVCDPRKSFTTVYGWPDGVEHFRYCGSFPNRCLRKVNRGLEPGQAISLLLKVGREFRYRTWNYDEMEKCGVVRRLRRRAAHL